MPFRLVFFGASTHTHSEPLHWGHFRMARLPWKCGQLSGPDHIPTELGADYSRSYSSRRSALLRR